ncbi:hypothetical protein NW762_013623 [Fusarium torreyae]|uniref:Uncharacterized protein n=1 Tax=Fusarium torreyae TaxID=1237075 RepID=A0A9W8RN02_9HYPO|nr:hypothetical protein NW762_013623 [Fusarium torreyae]
MAPIGIITIIVSAIRVGGPMWLKAVVGRAKENISNIEMELMSSTSREVCDLYNGTSIVRSAGTAPVWEYICLFPKGSTGSSSAKSLQIRFMTLKQAVDGGLLEEMAEAPNKSSPRSGKVMHKFQGADGGARATTTSVTTKKTLRNKLLSFRHLGLNAPEECDAEQGTPHEHSDHLQARNNEGVLENAAATDETPILTIIHDISLDAPNISLNLQNSHNRIWIRLVATIGVVLQSGVMIFFGLMTHPKYKSHFQRDDKPVANHAAPMTVTGTGLVVLAMIICGHVIESSTEEKFYRTTKDFEIGMYWVQQEQTVADQVFESFVTYPSSPRSIITMSRRKVVHPEVPKFSQAFRPYLWSQALSSVLNLSVLEVKTTIGAFIGVAGFVVQFIGLRAMNSWATLAQLVAVALMTFLRAIVRPGFTNSFEKAKLLPGFELDWLAWELVKKAKGDEISTESSIPGKTTSSTSMSSTEVTDPGKQHISPGFWAVNSGGSVEYKPFREPPIRNNQPTSYSNSEAYDVMTMRRGLCKLAGFQGRNSSITVNLALAIEKAMGIFFPHETEGKVYRWCLDIVHSRTNPTKGSKQQIWFDISHNGTSWQVLADNFDACLSLWSYTIQQEEEKSGEESQLRDPAGDDDDSWLRKSRSGLCFRLLGPKNEQLVQDLKWWAPQGTEMVIEIDKIAKYETKTGKGITKDRLSRKVDCSRIVGYSPSVLPPRSNISGLQALDISPAVSKVEKDGASLAIEARDSLVDLFAKDLLFSFMQSAEKTMKHPLPTKAELRPDASFSDHEIVCSLWNQDLTDLAEAFRKLGFGHEQEAFIGIVSPFSMAQRLPFPQALFDCVWSKIMKGFDGSSVEKWLKILEHLAQSYLKKDVGIWERYLALLVEVVREISTRVDLITKGNLGGNSTRRQDIWLLQGLKRILRAECAHKELFICLAYLYEKQRRRMTERVFALEVFTSHEPSHFPRYLHLTKLHHAAMSTSKIELKDILKSDKLSYGYIN